MAFENFQIVTDPFESCFGNIDVNLVNTPLRQEARDFVIFDFSAKLDPYLQCWCRTTAKPLKVTTVCLLHLIECDQKSVIVLG